MKVGAYQIPIKNGQVVFLDQDNDCTVFAYSSPFCLEDFLFLVMDLHSKLLHENNVLFLEEEI